MRENKRFGENGLTRAIRILIILRKYPMMSAAARTGFYQSFPKGHAMFSTKLDTLVRGVAVVLVATIGLLASTPNVHGTTESRGGAPCDVNKTLSQKCGDTGYSRMCLYTYTICYAVPGWRFMTCTLKPLSTNNCEKDVARCFPRDDYMPSGNCTPTYQEAGMAINSGSSARLSEVE